MISFSVNTSNVSAKTGALLQRFADPASPYAASLKQGAVLYLGFIRQRFVKAARGDGTWAPLAESTKESRLCKTKKGRSRLVKARKQDRASDKRLPSKLRNAAKAALTGSGNFEILRDTGILFNSLSQGSPGNVFKADSDSVTVGTVVKYAKYHQDPSRPGHPPQRTILVPPDAATHGRIESVIRRGVADTIKDVME